MDWEAKFKNYKKCTFDDVAEYVDAEKPEYTDKLTKQIEEGKDFLTIKKAFYQEYFESLIPVSAKKPNKMAEWAKAKKANK